MKDKWYADDRDLIKWGGIVHLCNETGIKRIFQVAYFRQHSWPVMRFNNEDVSIPEDVITHFRSIGDIKRLGKTVGLNIHVVNRKFANFSRDAYHHAICELIRKQSQRKVVFLDPDNGLAVDNATVKHVKANEVSLIWQSLNRRDFLVLYQHSFRDTRWRDIRRKQLAEACNIEKKTVKEWRVPKLANDVTFFYCEKK